MFLLTMLVRSLLVTAAFAGSAAPAAVAAPSLEPVNACYVAATEKQREFVRLAGHGFSGLAIVDFYVDESPKVVLTDNNEPVRTGWDGTLLGSVPAPFVDEGQRPFTVRVAERDRPENTASVSSLVTRLMVTQSPRRAATRDRVRFRGRGFIEPGPVYAHYVFAGKSQKTVRLGVPTGPCGLFSLKRRQFPFKNSPRRGVWTIQFDQVKAYDPKAAVNYRLTVRVSKQIKPRRAPARSR